LREKADLLGSFFKDIRQLVLVVLQNNKTALSVSVNQPLCGYKKAMAAGMGKTKNFSFRALFFFHLPGIKKPAPEGRPCKC